MTPRISPEQALERGREVMARGASKLLTITLEALRETATGAQDEVTLGAAEAQALLEHIAVLGSSAKAAASRASQTERARATERADAQELTAGVQALRAEVREWIARGEELLRRPM